MPTALPGARLHHATNLFFSLESMCAMKFDPYLMQMAKTKEQLDKELQREVAPVIDNTIPCLGNLVKRNWSSMSAYQIPESKTRFKSLADVINNRQFIGYYPESFGSMANYFHDNGISPYYEIIPGGDYAKGALTINTMIELTVAQVKWRLEREQDVGLVMGICEEYKKQLTPVLRPNSSNVNDIHVIAYYNKLEKFLTQLYKYAKRIEKKIGKYITPTTLEDILKLYE
jgi:hypothetical protein